MLWFILGAQLAAPTTCQEQYLAHLTTDMQLSYQQFDQTMDRGFRPLAKDCPAEAIDLIKNYIILNQATENSLRWHIAQLSGETGQIKQAILYAESTLSDQQQGEFKWNDYVQGYIAYWQKDHETLKAKIRILESSPEHQGNSINAKLLRQFNQELANQ